MPDCGQWSEGQACLIAGDIVRGNMPDCWQYSEGNVPDCG